MTIEDVKKLKDEVEVVIKKLQSFEPRFEALREYFNTEEYSEQALIDFDNGNYNLIIYDLEDLITELEKQNE